MREKRNVLGSLYEEDNGFCWVVVVARIKSKERTVDQLYKFYMRVQSSKEYYKEGNNYGCWKVCLHKGLVRSVQQMDCKNIQFSCMFEVLTVYCFEIVIITLVGFKLSLE